MKKKNTIILLVSILLVLIIGGIYFLIPYLKPIKSGHLWENNQVSEREKILLEFVDTKLRNDDGGIKTNYKEEKSDGDITKGSAVLSESQGIMLLYYLDRDRKGEFDQIVSYIKNNMLLNSGVISWRVDDGEKSQTSATIDDLRIVKALLLAEERWGDKSYRKLSINISRSIKKELLDGELLADFNDGKVKSDTTTLCYLDLETMKLISTLDKDYKKIYNTSLEVMNNGIVSSEIPLYRKEYNRESKAYDSENIDTLLSTIVLISRAEVGEDISKSVNWIKDKYKEDGGIYSLYNKETGKADSNIESTSIYANLLIIAEKIGDKELYDISIEKLKGYQILDKSNPIYGAYGDINTYDVYSFDNLNALLAWRKVKNL